MKLTVAICLSYALVVLTFMHEPLLRAVEVLAATVR